MDTHLLLSPCSSGRRTSSSVAADSNSPEFEFLRLRNPSSPDPNLLSADELFVDGVLLPLNLFSHHIHHRSQTPDPQPPNIERETETETELGPKISRNSIAAESSTTASKRWKDIFKKTPTPKNQQDSKEKEKDKKREKKCQTGATTGAELNINIWPFSRSRSAGNNAARPRLFPGSHGTRKVSSAPCSRSNSAGESKSRKWPSSPGRPGVHLGRSSPVWQLRRGGGGPSPKSVYSEPVNRSSEKVIGKKVSESRKTAAAHGGDGGNNKAKVLNLNVPMCIGYRRCRGHENSAVGVCGSGESRNGGGSNGSNSNVAGVGSGGGNLFNLRSLFTKKVY